ncbi:hypothetical protein Bca4012_100132 [Brassica carinata]
MKPDGKSPLIKHTGKTGVSSTEAVSDDPTSKKPNGKAVLHSDFSAKTCVSSARSVSDDPMSKKPNEEGELTDTKTKLAERRAVL